MHLLSVSCLLVTMDVQQVDAYFATSGWLMKFVLLVNLDPEPLCSNALGGMLLAQTLKSKFATSKITRGNDAVVNLIRTFALAGLVVTCAFTTSSLAFEEEGSGWEKVKSKGGAEVSQKEVANSPFKVTRGTLVSDANVFDAFAVLRDVDACEDWLHKCKHGEVVSAGTSQSVYYTVIDSPFILKDRDTYVQSTVAYDAQKHSLHIDMLGVEDTQPPHKKRVRVLDFTGYWLLEPYGAGRIMLTYQVHMDPQVSTTGAANSTLATSVLETLLNVDRLALQPPYLNSTVSSAELEAITTSFGPD